MIATMIGGYGCPRCGYRYGPETHVCNDWRMPPGIVYSTHQDRVSREVRLAEKEFQKAQEQFEAVGKSRALGILPILPKVVRTFCFPVLNLRMVHLLRCARRKPRIPWALGRRRRRC